MRAVVMEIRFQVCASPERFQKFFKHTTTVIQSEVPVGIRRSCVIEDLKSPFLRRQWERFNSGLTLPRPDQWEICYGFLDTTGWLTGAVLESIAADVVADLTPRLHRAPMGESVPWSVGLVTDPDGHAKAAMARRYPALSLTQLSPTA